MKEIYLLGDLHTGSAFRLAGVTGVVSDLQDAKERLESLVRKGDAAVILVTGELAEVLGGRMKELNQAPGFPLVLTLPGIDEKRGARHSALSYVSEALGISL